MCSGRNLGKERNGATQSLQYTAPTKNNGLFQCNGYNPKHTSHKTSDGDMFLNMDYEMHMGTKLDKFFVQSSRVQGCFKLQKYNFSKTNVSKNEQKYLVF